MKSMTSAVWRLACPDEYETDAVRHALRRSAMPSYVLRPPVESHSGPGPAQPGWLLWLDGAGAGLAA